ncbi:hypothetical protein BKA93DRAFT_880908, partial [Sparassis latifolia]
AQKENISIFCCNVNLSALSTKTVPIRLHPRFHLAGRHGEHNPPNPQSVPPQHQHLIARPQRPFLLASRRESSASQTLRAREPRSWSNFGPPRSRSNVGPPRSWPNVGPPRSWPNVGPPRSWSNVGPPRSWPNVAPSTVLVRVGSPSSAPVSKAGRWKQSSSGEERGFEPQQAKAIVLRTNSAL